MPLEASTPVVATPKAPSTSGIQEARDTSTCDSMEDFSERESVERFMHDSCGCKTGPMYTVIVLHVPPF